MRQRCIGLCAARRRRWRNEKQGPSRSDGTDGDGAGITATGLPAVRGIAAVDPDVIPLGTRLFIPGYGEAIAADTGGAIVGNKIDLVMDSYGEAIDFGRQDVTVYVLD